MNTKNSIYGILKMEFNFNKIHLEKVYLFLFDICLFVNIKYRKIKYKI